MGEKGSITQIKGIANPQEKRLNKAGYHTIRSIAEANDEDIRKVMGITNATARCIIRNAKEQLLLPDNLSVITGIYIRTNERLVRAGIDSFEKLAKQNPESLALLMNYTLKKAQDYIAGAKEQINPIIQVSTPETPTDTNKKKTDDQIMLDGLNHLGSIPLEIMHREVHLKIDLNMLLAIHTNLCLAMTHPLNDGDIKLPVQGFVKGIGKVLEDQKILTKEVRAITENGLYVLTTCDCGRCKGEIQIGTTEQKKKGHEVNYHG